MNGMLMLACQCPLLTGLLPLRYGRQVPFAFLESVKNEFREKYGEKARTAQAGSLDRAFGWEAMHTSFV